MAQDIILVNEQDEEIGYGEKMEVHKNKLLHRAFSIFIFDWSTHKLLLQKRAHGKYHSGGLWTNACCSHPRRNETMEVSLNTRLKEELGMDTDFHIVDPAECGLLIDGRDTIYSCGKFTYFADFGEVSEYEIDHVFLFSPYYGTARVPENAFAPDEVEELKWVSVAELKEWMAQKPEEFTAWFSSAFALAYEVLCRQAGDIDMFYVFGAQS